MKLFNTKINLNFIKNSAKFLILAFLIIYCIYILYFSSLKTVESFESYNKTEDCSKCEVKPSSGNCVKIYDFDTIYGEGFVNAKLEDSIYTQIGVTNKDNPVFDYHLSLNSLFKLEHFSSQKETIKFYEEQVPEEYRGNSNQFISYARLTNYKTNYFSNNTNLIPSNIQTPSDVLLNHPYFDVLRTKPKNAKIVDVIDSKIPHYNKVKHLKYMFK